MSILYILDNKQSNQINLNLLRYIYNNRNNIHVKVKKVDKNTIEILKKNKITKLPVLINKNNIYIGLSEIMNYYEKIKKGNTLGVNTSGINTLEKYYEEELKSNDEETSLGEEMKKNTRNNTKDMSSNTTGSNTTRSNTTGSNTTGSKQDDEDSKDDMMINAYLSNMHLSMN